MESVLEYYEQAVAAKCAAASQAVSQVVADLVGGGLVLVDGVGASGGHAAPPTPEHEATARGATQRVLAA